MDFEKKRIQGEKEMNGKEKTFILDMTLLLSLCLLLLFLVNISIRKD